MGFSRNMKQGDLEPPFNPVLYQDDGVTPYNLSTATSVKVTAKQAGAALFTSRSATGNASGQVTMTWSGTDTAVLGEITLEVEVEWTAARVQTFPAIGYFVVTVTPDLV